MAAAQAAGLKLELVESFVLGGGGDLFPELRLIDLNAQLLDLIFERLLADRGQQRSDRQRRERLYGGFEILVKGDDLPGRLIFGVDDLKYADDAPVGILERAGQEGL